MKVLTKAEKKIKRQARFRSFIRRLIKWTKYGYRRTNPWSFIVVLSLSTTTGYLAFKQLWGFFVGKILVISILLITISYFLALALMKLITRYQEGHQQKIVNELMEFLEESKLNLDE
jgi:hypothetical protein